MRLAALHGLALAWMTGCDLSPSKAEIFDQDGDGWFWGDGTQDDCDDANPDVNPGVEEVLGDGVDNDCDPETADTDGDGDGFGADQDCDDGNPEVNLAATEEPYNGRDDDCDEATLDDDLDGDGHGAAEDCDDLDAAINPDAEEVPYSGVDEDCDTATADDDVDGDGYALDEDCDDKDVSTFPGASEVCGDGVVNDCDVQPAETWDDCGLAGDFALADAPVKLLGAGADDRLGAKLAFVGDVNGDGLGDALLGAPRQESADETMSNNGTAYLLLGSPTEGIAGITEAAYARLIGVSSGDGLTDDDRATLNVSGAGDVDGDGFADLLVSLPGDDTGGADAGSVVLAYGPVPAGESELRGDVLGARFIGESHNGGLGVSIAGVGDVDEDGFDDLMVGAPWDDNYAVDAGCAFLLLGPRYGDVELDGATGDGRVFKFTRSDALSSAAIGAAVSSAGDLDGDGRLDLLVGAPGPTLGAVSVLMSEDLSASTAGDLVASYSFVVPGDSGAGDVVAGGADWNGDGYPEFAVGAGSDDDYGAEAGAVYVLSGDLSEWTSSVLAEVAMVKILGEEENMNTGRSVAWAGDLDGDGLADLLIGNSDDYGSDEIAAHLVPGFQDGVSLLKNAEMRIFGEEAVGEDRPDYAGQVAGSGDMDGDGVPDLLIGAYGDDTTAEDAGAVYLVPGGGRW